MTTLLDSSVIVAALASDEINPGAERTARAVFAHFSREADRQLVAIAA